MRTSSRRGSVVGWPGSHRASTAGRWAEPAVSARPAMFRACEGEARISTIRVSSIKFPERRSTPAPAGEGGAVFEIRSAEKSQLEQ